MELHDQPAPDRGEVRVKVRLTNSADAQAAQAGKLPADQVCTREADALVDTRAVRSCVPAPLLERLGIRPYEQRIVEYADGRKDSVGIADGVRFEIMHRKSSDDALALGDEVVVGQNLLEKMDLLVDWPRHRLVPNPAHPDLAISKVKSGAAAPSGCQMRCASLRALSGAPAVEGGRGTSLRAHRSWRQAASPADGVRYRS